MTKKRRFWLGFFALYCGSLVVGLILFGSPNYSGAYMKTFGEEHRRYLEITESEAFRLYEERPELAEMTDSLRQEIGFVEMYRARPEFNAERRRMTLNFIYFRCVNIITLATAMALLLKKPALAFLDGQISAIRELLESSATARAAAEERRGKAQAGIDEWPQKEAWIKAKTEDAINDAIVSINERARLARAQLERETEDRKRAEILAAIDRMRAELVHEAIQRVEERHRAEASAEDMKENVEQFVRLMETLS